MAKCHRNNTGSLLDRVHATSPSTAGSNSRLWTTFSASAFRRIILDTISCGGVSSRHRHHHHHHQIDSGECIAVTDHAKCASSAEKETTAIFHRQPRNVNNTKTEKLADLLNLAEALEASMNDKETRKKVEKLEELKRVMKELQLEDVVKSKAAASNVRLLAKEDSEARLTLSMLGAIPPLVGMLDFEDLEAQIVSLYALLNLGIGNDLNKAAILEAGAVHKMLKLIESPAPSNPSVLEAIVANFLGLSALDSNKPIIGSSDAIPFLVKSLKTSEDRNRQQVKQDSLRALYNLSIFPGNIPFILETDLIPYLLDILGDMEVSERILSILSNVVSTPEGRKAISVVNDAFAILIDVSNWIDSPGCQEKATYILMVMAHKSYGDRQAMIEAGIVSSLLELTLFGSTLVQKRASRILECLRVDKGKQVMESYVGNVDSTLSAPICGSSTSSNLNGGGSHKCLVEDEDLMSEENKAVKQLVQQSLQKNMRRIVKRANLPQDFIPSEHFKSLTSSSLSKSLPF